VRDRVTLYQHVTLGADRSERYPHIESDVVVYPQAVIAGSVIVGSNATVGALAKVTNDVPTGTTVRS
jgi:serine acetyltransferase